MADRFIFGAAPIDYGPVLLLMPFGFHLAMDTLPSAVPNSRCGQRVVTSAFGYGSPHLGARGTSTLLNNALLSAHFLFADYSAGENSTAGLGFLAVSRW